MDTSTPNELFGNVILLKDLKYDVMVQLSRMLSRNKVIFVDTTTAVVDINVKGNILSIKVNENYLEKLMRDLDGYICFFEADILIFTNFRQDALQRIVYLTRRYRLFTLLAVRSEDAELLRDSANQESVMII